MSKPASALLLSFICCFASITPVSVWAEQMQQFGDYEVHYIVFPTTDLNAKVAAKYKISRAKDRALVNISVLNGASKPVQATLTGNSENLLGQRQALSFSEVIEGRAIYYLALLRHADEEHHRISIDVTLPDGTSTQLKFQQKMYWDR